MLVIRRLLPIVLSLVVLATACGNPGNPESYSDQLRDFDGEELSVTEGNYRAGCEAANEEAGISNSSAYCECTYEAFADNVPFEIFKEYDKRVKDGVDNGTVTKADDLYEVFQEVYDSEDFDAFGDFRSEMKALEDSSDDTRALEELFSACS